MESDKERVRILSAMLDRKLRRVLAYKAGLCAAGFETTTPIGLEDFLCALHVLYRRQARKFFRDSEPLSKMAHELYPRAPKSGLFWRISQKYKIPKEMGCFISLDKLLVGVLWDAARLSAAGGRKKARIADIFSALALRDDITVKLYQERGLLLKGQLGARPGE